MASQSIRNRLRKVEQAKARKDKPKIKRLIYFDDEPIPTNLPPAEVVLIWDISGFDK